MGKKASRKSKSGRGSPSSRSRATGTPPRPARSPPQWTPPQKPSPQRRSPPPPHSLTPCTDAAKAVPKKRRRSPPPQPAATLPPSSSTPALTKRSGSGESSTPQARSSSTLSSSRRRIHLSTLPNSPPQSHSSTPQHLVQKTVSTNKRRSPPPQPAPTPRSASATPTSTAQRGSPESSSPPRSPATTLVPSSRGIRLLTPQDSFLKPRLVSPSSSPASASVLPEGTSTPIFDLYLDDVRNTLGKALQSIRDHLSAMLKNEGLLEEKIVTHPGGCILLRILPSASSTENPLYALYRTKDLYLDSILSEKNLYRFKDFEADLPAELKFEDVVHLKWKSNYTALSFDPDKDEIFFGESTWRELHKTLLVLAEKRITEPRDVKKAMVQLILVAEALRFPELEEWMLTTLARKEDTIIPLKITKLFHMWGNISKTFHKGKQEFKSCQFKDIKQNFKTYDEICSVLGVANRRNLRKELNEMAKKKKRRGS